MQDVLRAGAAVYNAGHFHAAHDAWEDRWLDLEDGTDDERLLHGLIQFTAAVHHGHTGNWSGAKGLADSAGDYLAGLPDDYRGVDVGGVRRYLAAVAADPETIERRDPLPLRIEDEVVRFRDLDFEAVCVAAVVLAAELDGYDAVTVERAVEYAREERAEGAQTRFITLLFDFVRETERRGFVYQRFADHVDRRVTREEDVEGLFD